MQYILKNTYNKDALISNIRNIEITNDIIRQQIKLDGYKIINNRVCGKWYIVKDLKGIDSLGMYNVEEELKEHITEASLLKEYLIQRM